MRPNLGSKFGDFPMEYLRSICDSDPVLTDVKGFSIHTRPWKPVSADTGDSKYAGIIMVARCLRC